MVSSQQKVLSMLVHEQQEETEIPRGCFSGHQTCDNRRCESSKTAVKKLAFVANTVVFKLNRATFRIKRHLTPTLKSDRLLSGKHLSSMRKFSSSSDPPSLRDLCTQLSSVNVNNLHGVTTAVSPTHWSVPELLFRLPRMGIGKLLDFQDALLLKICKYLDGRSVFSLSQTCSRLRKIILNHAHHLEKRSTSIYELSIGFNKEKRRSDVRALKYGRSLNDVTFEADSFQNIIPPLLRCLARVTFGNGVNMADWVEDLLQLYEENRIRPLALIFSGGNFTKGNQPAGVDMRCFSESEFVAFIRMFYPHLQEVQLSTTRLFKLCSSPPRLLSLISLVNYFGIIYERPTLRYFFDDVRRVVSFWLNDPLSRSCTVYMRRPHGCDFSSWTNLGGISTVVMGKVTEVKIKHIYISDVVLVFHLH